MFSLSQKNLKDSIKELISRFSMPTIIVIVFTALLYYFIFSSNQSELVIKTIFTLSIMFFFSTGICLYIENKEKNNYDTILHILPIIYGVYTYVTIDIWTDWFFESFIYLLLHLFGFVSFIFFAPYLDSFWNKKNTETEYTNYFSLTSWSLLMSGIVGGSLLALWFIAIGSVIALFDININEWKIFWYWAVIALAFCAPIYGLINFPIISKINKTNFEINRFFSFLIKYIWVPFIYIYFIILYAYSVRVLLNFGDWPKWIISWMVIWFSVFGYINYIFSKPYNWKFIEYFKEYFPIFVIPQLFMLFYAIYLRINQYDLTMNRYFVVIFGIWLLITSLYFVISKKKSLAMVTVSLTLISFIISIWPWSVFSLPLERQYNRLIKNLETAKILQNNTVTPLQSPQDITKELSNEIYSGIEYICDYSECKLIKDLFKNELKNKYSESEMEWKKWNKDSLIGYNGLSKWEIINIVTEKIKVQRSYSYEQWLQEGKYIQFNTSYKVYWPYPIDIDDTYTKIVNVYKDETSENYYKSYVYPFITINLESNLIKYHKSEKDITILPLVLNTNINKDTPNLLEQKDLTFKIKWDTLDIKLILESFAIKNPNYKWWGNEYYNVNGIAFIKE